MFTSINSLSAFELNHLLADDLPCSTPDLATFLVEPSFAARRSTGPEMLKDLIADEWAEENSVAIIMRKGLSIGIEDDQSHCSPLSPLCGAQAE